MLTRELGASCITRRDNITYRTSHRNLCRNSCRYAYRNVFLFAVTFLSSHKFSLSPSLCMFVCMCVCVYCVWKREKFSIFSPIPLISAHRQLCCHPIGKEFGIRPGTNFFVNLTKSLRWANYFLFLFDKTAIWYNITKYILCCNKTFSDNSNESIILSINYLIGLSVINSIEFDSRVISYDLLKHDFKTISQSQILA